MIVYKDILLRLVFFIFNDSSLLLAHYTLHFTPSSQAQHAVDSDVVKGKIKNELTQLDDCMKFVFESWNLFH